MRSIKFILSGLIIINLSFVFAQSGTFNFNSGVTTQGDPQIVMQTISGVTCTLSTENSNIYADVFWNNTDPDLWGTTGAYCYNDWDDPSTTQLVVTFSQAVNITTMRIGDLSYENHTMTFTPNTGTAQNHSIDGTNGTTVTLNFVGITRITITRQGGGQNNVVIDNIGMDAALPVELTSFTALIKNSIAELNWQTATEVDNYGFEIQRSAVSSQRSAVSGQLSDWENIGFVNGHGNSNSPKDYSFVDDKVSSVGKYFYRLKQIDTDGSYEYSKIVEVDFGQPNKFELKQNYPNPFNPRTVISYQLSTPGNVTLKIYDVLGNEVAVLVDNEWQEAGKYNYQFSPDASGFNSQFASGLYFYQLRTGDFVQVKKMILAK